MEITDEIRQAVLDETCAANGCDYNFSEAIGPTDRPNPNDPRGMPMRVLRSSTAGRVPYVYCPRCGRVWLILDEPGRGYADAVAKAVARFGAAGDAPVNGTAGGAAEALEPMPVDGTKDRPIPLAAGLTWDALPEDHPSKVWQRQQDAADEHLDAAAVAEPDPAAEQPEPGALQVITTTPEESS